MKKKKEPVIIFGSDDRGRYEAAMKASSGRVKLISAVEFIEKMINAIKNEKISEFRRSFRNIDTLIVRDIETMAGKERTQEEMLEAFRSLYLDGKQVVVTLYDIPNRIKGFSRSFKGFLNMAKAIQKV